MTEPRHPSSVRRRLNKQRQDASTRVESVARDLGLVVQRLDQRVLLIRGGGRLIAFFGLLGPSVGHAMQLFCDSIALARMRWSQANLPVMEHRLVSRSDERGALSAVAEFGGHAMLGPAVAGAGNNHLVEQSDRTTFGRAWRVAAAATGSGRMYNRVLVEPVPRGKDLRVAVVAGEPVRAIEVSPAQFNQRPSGRDTVPAIHDWSPLPDGPVMSVVTKAYAALPGLPYCTIHLAVEFENRTPSAATLRHVELEPDLTLFEQPDPFIRAIIELELRGSGESSRRE